MNINDIENRARSDYQKALRQAFWREIRQRLGRGCNDLLPFGEVYRYLRKQPRSHLGDQHVPLEQIVGSSRRYRDFDLAYNPRRKSRDNRWVNVAKAKYEGVLLPPVLLYKVGEAFFAEDGNHRVSVARVTGEKVIKARVIEIDASSLRSEPACTRLGYQLGGKESCNGGCGG